MVSFCYWGANVSKTEGNSLIFTTSNSTNEKATIQTKGIGLANLNKRLEMIYPEKYSLKLNAGEHEFNVLLTIQINND